MRISGTEPSSVILSQTVNIMFFEQNRESAEWYSRWKVEKRHTKFKKTALNNWSISKSKKKGGRNQVSGHIRGKCSKETSLNSVNVKFGTVNKSV